MYNPIKNDFRRKQPKWPYVVGVILLIVLFIAIGCTIYVNKDLKSMREKTVEYMRPDVAEAAETPESLALKSIEELKQEMIAKIWKTESEKYQQKTGELFITYDPTEAMKKSGVCLIQGGRRVIDCDSYGAMQEKIGTIQEMWPKIHDGKLITQTEAFLVAQDPVESKKFFVECALKVERCVFRWTYAYNNPDWFNIIIPHIRKAEGIKVI